MKNKIIGFNVYETIDFLNINPYVPKWFKNDFYYNLIDHGGKILKYHCYGKYYTPEEWEAIKKYKYLL
jgi:hypothetical protein